MAEDSELWNIICDGPFVPMKKDDAGIAMVPKMRKEYNETDRKAVEKNYRDMKILVCFIGANEYNQYELFKMKNSESVDEIHTRFTSIINELHSLGEIIPINKLVRKLLSVLPSSWEIKVNDISEAKDLK
ncbi:uncharacterized protein LOC132637709 [Lycium barbarum]|uniref:uncharacterized protein LOC132637709 n=1 Tax=Lycium barbarum TaxID=112863 RepID=UPI00293E9937|nr:uncharacterized protein LOC132637709 [Lycium barbarum]